MNDLLLKIIFPVLAGLILVGITSLVRKRRLFLIAPRLFSSGLTDRGNIVEITLLNRGIYTEEEIEVSLNPKCNYEMVACTSRDLSLKDKKFYLHRMPPENEVTIIFLAEGKEFAATDIVSLTSKVVQGKIIKNFTDVFPSTKKIGFTILVYTLIILASVFVGNKLFLSQNTILKKIEENNLLQKNKDIEKMKMVSYWKNLGWEISEDYFETTLFTSYGNNKIPIEINGFTRDGGNAVVKLNVNNKAANHFSLNANLLSPASDPKNKYISDSSLYGLLFFPKTSKEIELKTYLPKGFPQQLLIIEINISYEKHLLEFKRTLNFTEVK